MEKKDTLTKILAVFGSVLIWFPILAPILLGLGSLITRGRFLFDYLMPAELFLSALAGSGLLLWASLRSHSNSNSKLIGWGLVTAVVMLFGGQGIAVITGLASGATEPTAGLMALVLVPLGIYVLALIVIGVGGVKLTQNLFKHTA
ncbi:MAG: hypothetical protein HZB50_13755 [Chloroflexi bacterium]|nr:hypothetical protein [Chloroflexota bacterium]